MATRDVIKNEIIFYFEKNFVPEPNNFTLRINENKHQLSENPSAKENFLNHSCYPSAYIDFDLLALRAIREVRKGEEVTYNYFTTDWDGEDIFECKCGSSGCIKQISGFKYLPYEEKIKIKKFLSPFLLKKFERVEYEKTVKK